MKTYVFLANGFEMLEAFTPVDVLKRCGGEVITVSTEKDLFVASSQKNIVKADIMIDDVQYQTADLIIIPGGYPGYINLRENQKVVDIVKYYLNNNKYIASICGGPTIFSFNKLAYGTKLTAHTSTKDDFTENYVYVGTSVFVDNKIITAIGAGKSLDFSFKIAEQFFNKEKIEAVKKGMEII